MTSTTISGAYGRDYKSAEDALKDWKGGKDFYCHAINGFPSRFSYCSIRDFGDEDEINIRYDKLTEKVILNGGTTNA